MSVAPVMSPAPVADPRRLASVPRPVVKVAGVDLSANAAATLGPVRVRREASRPAVCELDFAVVPDGPTVRPGQDLSVGVDHADLFAGEVVAVEHRLGPDRQHRVLLRAFDAAHKLRRHSEVTAHTDVTVAGLAGTLAGTAGLGVHADVEGPRWPRIIQAGESDLALLGRLCADAGLWWRLDGNDLRLSGWVATGERNLTWGVDVVEAVIAQDSTAPLGRLDAVGWDPVTRKRVTGNADAGQVDGADRSLVGGLLAGDDQAAGLARAGADRATAEGTHLRAVLRGDVAWRPGLAVTIDDQPEPFGGPFLLTAAEHVIDAASGWMTVVDTRPVPPPARPTAGGLTLLPAVVNDVADPDRSGRVKVTFEVLADAESEWLPVLALGAGEGKGLYCQPDVGDTVLVLATADDPGRGVVLGGVFATATPTDGAGVRDSAVRAFSWTTPDGQRLVLDRDADVARLANRAGSRVEFTESGVLLHAEADLTIEAPGRRLLIRADTVDFERG